jgi:predicted transcriptional regulator
MRISRKSSVRFEMPTRSEIRAFAVLPATVGQIAEKLHLSAAGASKIVAGMAEKGLAVKRRDGKEVVVGAGETLHARKLKEALTRFPRIPLDQVLSHSNVALLAALSKGSLGVAELSAVLGATRQWISKSVSFLGRFGIILKSKGGYARSSIHASIVYFADSYCSFINHKIAARIAEDAAIVWEMGPEFLFSTRKNVDFQITATAAFPDYGIPVIAEVKYYYYSKRKVDSADVLLHTILVSPQSAAYNSYACLFYEKAKPERLKEKAKIYNLSAHIEKLVEFVESGGSDFIVSREDYDALKKEYGLDESI